MTVRLEEGTTDTGLARVQDYSPRDEHQASTLMTCGDKYVVLRLWLNRYLALCATSALFRWLEEGENIVFGKGTIGFRFSKHEGELFTVLH